MGRRNTTPLNTRRQANMRTWTADSEAQTSAGKKSLDVQNIIRKIRDVLPLVRDQFSQFSRTGRRTEPRVSSCTCGLRDGPMTANERAGAEQDWTPSEAEDDCGARPSAFDRGWLSALNGRRQRRALRSWLVKRESRPMQRKSEGISPRGTTATYAFGPAASPGA